MSANIQDFEPNTPYNATQALANLMPKGLVFEAKNINDSELRKLLIALSKEFSRAEAAMYVLASQFIPTLTVRFLQQWEEFLGIPDSCLLSDLPDLQRQKDIVLKFGLLNLFTKEDYYAVAELLGVEIVTFDNSVFGVINIEINSGSNPPDNTFDMDFDIALDPEGAFIFGDLGESIFRCVIEKYAPAFVQVNISVA